MSLALRSAYQLVDGVLDNGLAFVGAYLEKNINRPIVIVNQSGFIHYPERSDSDDLLYSLPTDSFDNDYYDESRRCLYYSIEYSGGRGYIVVKNLSKKALGPTMVLLTEARLAIKCYFATQYQADQSKAHFERKLGEYLWLSSSDHLPDILQLRDTPLNLEAPYYAVILQVDPGEEEPDGQEICAYSREYWRNVKRDAIPLVWANCVTILISARFGSDVREGDPDWPRLVGYKDSVAQRFQVGCSMGIGRTYALSDIKKSFYEARIALTLPLLMQQQQFVHNYVGLGVFAHIFTQDPEALAGFFHKALGPVMEYDKANNGELIPTLRQLLDSGVNWKSTADALYIHINTLYYRINKVEELLHADLSKMDTRVNLYTAIKVWDTLKAIGCR